MAAIGFFGKVPTAGDFVSRRIPRETLDIFDRWLETSLAVSQDRLGSEWLDYFLTSPIWHFSCSSGILGGNAWSGVMIPSVDRVGRYFPLTVLAEWCPPSSQSVLIPSDAWFDQASAIALTALMDNFDLEKFDQDLLRLQRPVSALVAVDDIPTALDDDRRHHLRPSCIWSTSGSHRMPKTRFLFDGLPPALVFEQLLGSAPMKEQSSESVASQSLIASRGWTHPGLVRSSNQDAILERSDAGFWAVADGMGGHLGGEFASQSITTSLQLHPFHNDANLLAKIQELHEVLKAVHASLQTHSFEKLGGQIIGSTLVLLVIQGADGAVLWAGDSRLYRLRDNVLTQLTDDHVPEQEFERVNSNQISRAIGATPNLELETRLLEVLPGDRFLLCSDGLYRDLDHDQLERLVAIPEMQAAGENLTANAIASGGKDNISLILVDNPEIPRI